MNVLSGIAVAVTVIAALFIGFRAGVAHATKVYSAEIRDVLVNAIANVALAVDNEEQNQ